MRLEGEKPPTFDALRRIWQNRDLRDYIARYELGEWMNGWETQTKDEDDDPFADGLVDDEDGSEPPLAQILCGPAPVRHHDLWLSRRLDGCVRRRG
jgi:hypothetical protein